MSTMHKRARISLKNDSTQAVLMLLPMLLGFALFTYGPILYILRFCLYRANDFKSSYIGFDNFARLFSRDAAFWDATLNTLILSFGKLLVEIPLAMVLAILFNRGIRGTGFFRTMLFLPAITSTAIVGLVVEGVPHFHIVCSDQNGTYAGHLEPGCEVLYLAEIVLLELTGKPLRRVTDENGLRLLARD